MTARAALLDDAIACLEQVVDDLGDRQVDDTATPCVDWTVRDLAAHLEAIAGSYVMWASAVAGGRTTILRSGAALAAWNQEMIDRVPGRKAIAHARRWAELARDHACLVRAFGGDRGLRLVDGSVLTIDEHAGIAALEWWLHAHDLATATVVEPPSGAIVPALIDVWHDHLEGVTGQRAGGGRDAATLLRLSGRGRW